MRVRVRVSAAEHALNGGHHLGHLVRVRVRVRVVPIHLRWG